MRRARPQAGFTLLELLIAVAVLAIVLAIIYESYWIATRNVTAAQEQSDLYQSARLALRRLSEDLMCAYIPLTEGAGTGATSGGAAGTFRCLDISAGTVDQDTLEFQSGANLARGPAGYMDWCELHYGVEGSSLVRTSTAGTADSESVELAPNVKGLDFRLLNSEGDEFEEWDSSETKELPAIVHITLVMGAEDDDKTLSFSTAVNIPLAWERAALGRGVARLAAEEERRAAQKAASKKEGAEEEEEEGIGPGDGKPRKPGQPPGGADDDDDDEDEED